MAQQNGMQGAASATATDVETLLKPCPEFPNCVSTLAQDALHAIAPIPYTGPAAAAQAQLLAVIRALPRTRVVAAYGDYLHVTFTSLIFRFVDDVEFVFDDRAKLIHFRSASRLGKGDLGVNRRRMEQIRKAFAAQSLTTAPGEFAVRA